MTLSIMGILFLPLSVAGIIMGSIAKERSGGKVGQPAINAGVAVIVIGVLCLAVLAAAVGR